MNKNHSPSKQIITSSIVVLALLVSFIFSNGPSKLWKKLISATNLNAPSVSAVQASEATSQKLSVHFIDVDQGDCTLVCFEQYRILIDCAKKSEVQNVLTYLEQMDVDRLDMVIATHPDADHIGGFADLVYQIKPALYVLPQLPSSLKRTQTELTLLNTLKTLKVKTEYAVNEKEYYFGDMCLSTYLTEMEHDNKNDYSVVTKITYKNASFLLMGDAGKSVESEMMSNSEPLRADVLKAGHHGSSKSSSEKFVKYVSPMFCVFSCGLDNEYGHPHHEVLKIMNKYNVRCFRTDELGTIVIGSDGSNYFTSTEKTAS